MIIRSAVTCNTCGKLHVVRIGMGQEEHQSHHFPCRCCGEDIAVGLVVDYVNITAEPVPELNCSLAQEQPGAEIVNLDANFVIPASAQGQDMTFARLAQLQAITKRAIAAGADFTPVDLDDPKLDQRPFRRRDFKAEWLELRRAWTLHRRRQDALSRGVVKKSSTKLYSDHPLTGLPDWLWRLCLHLTAPAYHPPLKAMMERVKVIYGMPAFEAFH